MDHRSEKDAIVQTLNRVAYILDAHAYARLGEAFARDVDFDNPGRLTVRGIDALIRAFEALSVPAISHHITNVLIDEVDIDVAACTSKALALRPGGVVTAAVYRDALIRTPDGWRIARRQITQLD